MTYRPGVGPPITNRAPVAAHRNSRSHALAAWSGALIDVTDDSRRNSGIPAPGATETTLALAVLARAAQKMRRRIAPRKVFGRSAFPKSTCSGPFLGIWKEEQGAPEGVAVPKHDRQDDDGGATVTKSARAHRLNERRTHRQNQGRLTRTDILRGPSRPPSMHRISHSTAIGFGELLSVTK